MKPARFINTPKTEKEIKVFPVVKKSNGVTTVKYGKSNAHAKAAIIGICAGMAILAVYSTLYAVNSFFSTRYFTFHSPIIIQAPIQLHTRKTEIIVKEIIKESTQSAQPSTPIAQVDDLDAIVAKVHMLETTRGKAPTGKHVTCKNKGMSNEYGYRAHENYCFSTHEEATATVKDWFKRSLEKRSLAASLCRYNIGTPTEDCQYYQEYKKL